MFKSLENMACEESFRALSLSNLTKGAIETVLQVSGAQKTVFKSSFLKAQGSVPCDILETEQIWQNVSMDEVVAPD